MSLFCDCAKLRGNVAWPLKHVICVQGSWGGLGVTRRRPKKDRLEQQRQKAAQMRKDAALDHVIINERSDAKVTTHHSQILSFFFFSFLNIQTDLFHSFCGTQANRFTVPSLPHPFETIEQYERSRALPLGPEWNTETQHKIFTKPKVCLDIHVFVFCGL